MTEMTTSFSLALMQRPPTRPMGRAPRFNLNRDAVLPASSSDAHQEPSCKRLNGGSFPVGCICVRRLKGYGLHVVHVAIAHEAARSINFRERPRTGAKLIENANTDGLANNVRTLWVLALWDGLPIQTSE